VILADIVVMAAYFAVVLAIGFHFGRRQENATDYFLGNRDLPWWAIMLSIVATETSALTVISIPGIAARGNLTFLQIPLGYLIGRIAVAIWLLPGYFSGDQQTAYTRLERRFGGATRRTASAVFMLVRSLGDSVRVFATAIPLSIITGWSVPMSVAVVVAVTVVYTWMGGIKAVVWVDVLQMCVYLVGGIATIIVAANLIGIDTLLDTAREAGKLKTLDTQLSLTVPYTLLSGLVGGALLSAASHGTDHLIVQRLLAARSLGDARYALVGSGVLVIIQFAVFLLVGSVIWAVSSYGANIPGDELYPRFVLDYLPPGVSGLVIAGILAAAMSTVSSSLNSLASATTHDFYSYITGKSDPAHLLKVGRILTVVWAIILTGGALSFSSSDQPVVVLALSIASITYGALLGTYLIAGSEKRYTQFDAITSITITSLVMLVVVLIKPGPFADLAWPWYVPLGTATSLIVSSMSSLIRNLVDR